MKISKISIENFRGLQKITLSPAQMNCIIGENNAGKSTILLAINLFLRGTKIAESDYYDKSKEIFIDITFSEISDNDLNKIADEENRLRIKSICDDNGQLEFRRKYKLDCTSELLFYKNVPQNIIYRVDWYSFELKGKKSPEIKKFLKNNYDIELSDTSNVTQAMAKKSIEEKVEKFSPDDFCYEWENIPTGINNTITPMFPEPIYIPAVKDFSDETKNKESTSFGKLVKILFTQIEASDDFKVINNAFMTLNRMLNRVIEQENGVDIIKDERLEGLKNLESEIQTIFQESFPKIKLELNIPNPETKQIFSNTQILIDDGIKTTVEYKGDGVKRTLIFSILRAYVEKINIDKSNVDYIFLFEEPELYLHPNGQRILYNILENLSIKDQVFVTTHSPSFFSATSINTNFIKIYKDTVIEPPCSKVKEINFVQNSTYKDAFQIICYENSTSAFFCKKVLLVEGDSDLIFFKGLSKLINESYCFDRENIGIIRINGKTNIKRFIEFYEHFDIQVYSLLDLDILIDGFEHLELGSKKETINRLRSKFLAELDEICEVEDIKNKINGEIIRKQVEKRTWTEKYIFLKYIVNKIKNNEKVSLNEIEDVETLFEFETNNKRREALKLQSTYKLESKIKLINQLYDSGYFVLSLGAIESYYPLSTSGEDKPSKALNALKNIKDISYLPKIFYREQEYCELSLIMNKIFEDKIPNIKKAVEITSNV